MSKKYYCNPININYHYQFNRDPRQGGRLQINREAADPSMILFHGKYYIFASMNLSVWVSEDMVHWESRRLPDSLPLYDYAPDVRVMGEYVYFCASSREHICDWYRTKDVEQGPYEKVPGSFSFWDPNLFVDDDGRVYFYWGCTNTDPIYGTELDPETMHPIGERKELIFGDPYTKGYERIGEDNTTLPASEEEIERSYQAFVKQNGGSEDKIPKELRPMIRGMFSKRPYIEGAWMDKHNGNYYLQYACPGAQYNIYADGVYVSRYPLGPFRLAENNPYSYKPGGFLPGAGHGSTMRDRFGNLWHTSTMRISVNHDFERRVGLWLAGFEEDGELFCNQRYGDWPLAVTDGALDPWKDPEWYLLSYGKKTTASSFSEGREPENATDENVQTWWRAESAEQKEWLQVDLGQEYEVHAIQINFADDHLDIPSPGKIGGSVSQARFIDETRFTTRWKLSGSADGEHWFVIEDKSGAETDLSHDLVIREEGITARYLKLTDMEVPYGQNPCISGLRVFGRGNGARPEIPVFTVTKATEIDMDVTIQDPGAEKECRALGYNILFGSSQEKLYHSYLTFGKEKRIGALIKSREYYVRVDAFNENGITEGTCVRLR